MSDPTPSVAKEVFNHGVAWETAYGYAQAVKAGQFIYVSGQLSHDAEGRLVAPAAVDANGKPKDFSRMEAQMRTTYENTARLLAHFGASFEQVVEETLFVLDVDAAFAVAGRVRGEVYGARPQVASNLIGVSRLAFPEQLIEITFKVDLTVAKGQPA